LLLALAEHLCFGSVGTLKKSIVIDKTYQRVVLPCVAFYFFVALTLQEKKHNYPKQITLHKSSKNSLHNKDPTIIVVSGRVRFCRALLFYLPGADLINSY